MTDLRYVGQEPKRPQTSDSSDSGWINEELSILTSSGTSSSARRKVARQMSSCQIESTTRPASGCDDTRSRRPSLSRPSNVLPCRGSGEVVTSSVCDENSLANRRLPKKRRTADDYSGRLGV